MLQSITIRTLDQNPGLSGALFKPVQRQIIGKLARGENLSENEKRYLRGNLGRKLAAIDQLLRGDSKEENLQYPFLDSLDNYYITGFEALRHNGFGWFYDSKTVIVMNTRLKGSAVHSGKKIRFIRVRSMSSRGIQVDRDTGLRYATNEQIFRDARELKDETLRRTWNSMLERYGEMFVRSPERYKMQHKGQHEGHKNRQQKGQSVSDTSSGKPEDYGV